MRVLSERSLSHEYSHLRMIMFYFFRLRIHTSYCVLPKILYGMGYAFNFVPISLSWLRPRSPWAPLHLCILNICCLGPVEAVPRLNFKFLKIHIVVSVHAKHLVHFSEILWYGLRVQLRSHFSELAQAPVTLGPTPLIYPEHLLPRTCRGSS